MPTGRILGGLVDILPHPQPCFLIVSLPLLGGGWSGPFPSRLLPQLHAFLSLSGLAGSLSDFTILWKILTPSHTMSRPSPLWPHLSILTQNRSPTDVVYSSVTLSIALTLWHLLANPTDSTPWFPEIFFPSIWAFFWLCFLPRFGEGAGKWRKQRS